MKHEDFSIGTEFRFNAQSWKCTDVGSRTIVAICTTEVWRTRTRANTGIKERYRLQVVDKQVLAGPPYGVSEQVFDERALADCLLLSEWERARQVLGIDGRGGTTT
jgi:hypothetical protein